VESQECIKPDILTRTSCMHEARYPEQIRASC
jgi:hypothetical protein